eukprot:gnl/TRDRNA2_/TRDRNA2_36869_c0_seq1.p2 gnl/TRDRNA2_/TRDRNA2_36869_c0~~gnl/TRDRNA2_/TRDRNA2_36869_c0_seq1.p2  ORF type:complete len:133 (-),score=7.20 gnl/TRDRNA2_/TRDRNA2_36869_c0_seq1:88-486(-)
MITRVRDNMRALCACRARSGRGPDENQGGAMSQDAARHGDDVELLAERVEPGSRADSAQGQRCIRCVQRLGSTGRYYCSVAVRSIFDGDPPCPHGPYCSKCKRKLDAMTLSTCACRAMIQEWPEQGKVGMCA